MTWRATCARHVFKHISNFRFLSCVASYDVASKIYQALHAGTIQTLSVDEAVVKLQLLKQEFKELLGRVLQLVLC